MEVKVLKLVMSLKTQVNGVGKMETTGSFCILTKLLSTQSSTVIDQFYITSFTQVTTFYLPRKSGIIMN
jgi:hypothetical protein